MLPNKFQCGICNQCFMYQTDLIKHINAHMVKPPPSRRVSVIKHTSDVPNSSSSDARCGSSRENAGISIVNSISTESQTKFPSPKNGNKTSEPTHVCTSTKPPDDSTQIHTSNVQILSPDKTGSGPTEEINAILKETATTSKDESESSKKRKNRSKSSNTDCATSEEFFCQFCQKHFDSRPELHQHFELTHQVEIPFKCILCNNEYQLDYTLCLHERELHADIIVYRCPKCFKRFFTKIRLKTHNCRIKNPLVKTNQSPGSSSELK